MPGVASLESRRIGEGEGVVSMAELGRSSSREALYLPSWLAKLSRSARNLASSASRLIDESVEVLDRGGAARSSLTSASNLSRSL